MVQSTQYYPFGASFADASGTSTQPYKYNAKELDSRNGLNMYDYSARWKGDWSFSTIDPLAEKYYNISPYVYVMNNPLRFIDIDGKAPGDIFKSVRAAATDWGNYYNGASILRGNEFGSTIYKVDGGYSYSVANEGDYRSVHRSPAPNGEKKAGIIHSHGEYLTQYKNDDFGGNDIPNSKKEGVNAYVATPDGALLEYDVKTGKTNTVSQEMPSDPKDPGRKNKIDPVDIPKQKEEQAAKVAEELKKKEEFRGTHGGNSTMNP